MYLFLDSETQLGKSNEFNNYAKKGQVKSAFKTYKAILFCHQKTMKEQKALHEISLIPYTSVQQVPQSPISESTLPYSVAPLFQRISQHPCQDRQNRKQTQCLLPTQFFRINLKDALSYISIKHFRAFSLSRMFNEFFPKPE